MDGGMEYVGLDGSIVKQGLPPEVSEPFYRYLLASFGKCFLFFVVVCS